MSDSGRLSRTSAELNAEANAALTAGLTSELRTALRVVCASPHTVADAVYRHDIDHAIALAQKLKVIAELLKG